MYSPAELKANNAAGQAFFGPVGHHPPRGMHRKYVDFDREKAGLFGTNPLGVPGHIHLGDPAITLKTVDAGIGDHAAQQGRSLFGVGTWFAPLCREHEGETAFRSEDHIASGLIAHRRECVAAGLLLNVVAQQLPGAMNGGGSNGLSGLNRTEGHN